MQNHQNLCKNKIIYNFANKILYMGCSSSKYLEKKYVVPQNHNVISIAEKQHHDYYNNDPTKKCPSCNSYGSFVDGKCFIDGHSQY
jgi:hypothetical protein